MAALPTLDNKMNNLLADIDDGSRVTPSEGGTNRIARLHPEFSYRFSVEWVLVTALEFETLLEFYRDNRFDSSIELSDIKSGHEYLIQMLAPPKVKSVSGILYTIGMEVEGPRAL